MRPLADLIDAGKITSDFLGFVRSAGQKGAANIDSSRIILEFRDKDNASALAEFDSKPRRVIGRWEPIGDRRVLPRGTRWVRVRLVSVRHGKGTKSNDGFHDGLTLKLAKRD